jgi:hypothetical protein
MEVIRMAQVKCPVCGEMLEKDGAVPYKSRYYHVECFESHFKEDVVGSHYFYLDFMKVMGREPYKQEFIQCRNLIKDGWNWQKITDVFYYTYVIENTPESLEHGTIGILPYMELKAKAFYRTKWEADESNEGVEIDEEPIVLYGRQIRKPKPKKKSKDIDRLVGSDDVWD